MLTGRKYRGAVESHAMTFRPLPEEVDYDDANLDAWLPGRKRFRSLAAGRYDIIGIFIRPLRSQYYAFADALASESYDAVVSETGFLGVLPVLLSLPAGHRIPIAGVSATPVGDQRRLRPIRFGNRSRPVGPYPATEPAAQRCPAAWPPQAHSRCARRRTGRARSARHRRELLRSGDEVRRHLSSSGVGLRIPATRAAPDRALRRTTPVDRSGSVVPAVLVGRSAKLAAGRTRDPGHDGQHRLRQAVGARTARAGDRERVGGGLNWRSAGFGPAGAAGWTTPSNTRVDTFLPYDQLLPTPM